MLVEQAIGQVRLFVAGAAPSAGAARGGAASPGGALPDEDAVRDAMRRSVGLPAQPTRASSSVGG